MINFTINDAQKIHPQNGVTINYDNNGLNYTVIRHDNPRVQEIGHQINDPANDVLAHTNYGGNNENFALITSDGYVRAIFSVTQQEGVPYNNGHINFTFDDYNAILGDDPGFASSAGQVINVAKDGHNYQVKLNMAAVPTHEPVAAGQTDELFSVFNVAGNVETFYYTYDGIVNCSFEVTEVLGADPAADIQ